MKERLVLFLEHLKIGQKKFEKECNLSNSFVNNIGYSIREVNINKISSKYPELNISWLMTGKGEMLIENEYSKNNELSIVSEPAAEYGNSDMKALIRAVIDIADSFKRQTQNMERMLNLIEEKNFSKAE